MLSCRYCREPYKGCLIFPCNCADPIHSKCLNEERSTRSLTRCPRCNYRYKIYIGGQKPKQTFAEFFTVLDINTKIPDYMLVEETQVNKFVEECVNDASS